MCQSDIMGGGNFIIIMKILVLNFFSSSWIGTPWALVSPLKILFFESKSTVPQTPQPGKHGELFCHAFYSILPLDLVSVQDISSFGTHIDLFKEKSVQLYFLKILSGLSILLNYFVLYRSGEGDAKFLLRCHTLCPICRYPSLSKNWDPLYVYV